MKIRASCTQKAEKENSRLISTASVSTTGSTISELRGTLVVKTIARHVAKVVTGKVTNTAVRPQAAVLSSTRLSYQDWMGILGWRWPPLLSWHKPGHLKGQ